MATGTPTEPIDLVHGGEAARFGGWNWRRPRRGDHFRTCSYCGSISPQDLAEELSPGGDVTVEWADQKYGWPHKFYVQGLRPRNSKLVHCFSHTNSEDRPEGGSYPWVAAAELTRTQRKIIAADGMMLGSEEPYGWYAFRPKTELHAKFYTVHLKDPQLPAEAAEKITRECGLRFHFSGGSVRWHGVLVPCEEAHPSEGG